MRFQGKAVFITGGYRGLGKALAKAFLDEGASVAVNGRNRETVTAFEEEFKGQPVLAFAADISNYGEMEAALQKSVEKWGKVDVLVHNAGIVNPLAPSEKMKREDFDRVIDTNLKGSFYVLQLFGRKMLEQGSGRIINISSQVALYGEKGFLPYAISKAALNVMTTNLAYEWSGRGVTICSLAPGFIRGGMNEGLIKKQQFVDHLSNRTPLKRMGTVEEFVATALFLASDAARYINGTTVAMDGGMTGFNQEPLLDMIAKGK
jgi:NAD(P)-dependent dehydrogenase (short-subunit alcohol dehydrogenase family)